MREPKARDYGGSHAEVWLANVIRDRIMKSPVVKKPSNSTFSLQLSILPIPSLSALGRAAREGGHRESICL
jgi:hypothetical protein